MTEAHDHAPLTPVTLEIVEGVPESTMREIEAQVERRARSTNIREANDHVPAIFDAAGRSVASVSLTANVDPILKRWRAPAAEVAQRMVRELDGESQTLYAAIVAERAAWARRSQQMHAP